MLHRCCIARVKHNDVLKDTPFCLVYQSIPPVALRISLAYLPTLLCNCHIMPRVDQTGKVASRSQASLQHPYAIRHSLIDLPPIVGSQRHCANLGRGLFVSVHKGCIR